MLASSFVDSTVHISDFCFAFILFRYDCALDRREHGFFFSSFYAFVVIQYWHKLKKQCRIFKYSSDNSHVLYRPCVQIPLSFYAIMKNYIIFSHSNESIPVRLLYFSSNCKRHSVPFQFCWFVPITCIKYMPSQLHALTI